MVVSISVVTILVLMVMMVSEEGVYAALAIVLMVTNIGKVVIERRKRGRMTVADDGVR